MPRHPERNHATPVQSTRFSRDRALLLSLEATYERPHGARLKAERWPPRSTLLAVLMALIARYNRREAQHPFPSRERIAKDVGVSLSTVKAAIRALEELGHIRRQRGAGWNGTNVYEILIGSMRVMATEQGEDGSTQPETGDPDGSNPRRSRFFGGARIAVLKAAHAAARRRRYQVSQPDGWVVRPELLGRVHALCETLAAELGWSYETAADRVMARYLKSASFRADGALEQSCHPLAWCGPYLPQIERDLRRRYGKRPQMSDGADSQPEQARAEAAGPPPSGPLARGFDVADRQAARQLLAELAGGGRAA